MAAFRWGWWWWKVGSGWLRGDASLLGGVGMPADCDMYQSVRLLPWCPPRTPLFDSELSMFGAEKPDCEIPWPGWWYPEGSSCGEAIWWWWWWECCCSALKCDRCCWFVEDELNCELLLETTGELLAVCEVARLFPSLSYPDPELTVDVWSPLDMWGDIGLSCTFMCFRSELGCV